MDVQSCLVVGVEGPHYLGEPVGMASRFALPKKYVQSCIYDMAMS